MTTYLNKTATPPLIPPQGEYLTSAMIGLVKINGSIIQGATRVEIKDPPISGTDAVNKDYVDSSGGQTPGGIAESLQFNSDPAGTFSGSSDLLWDDTTKVLSANGSMITNTMSTNVITISNTPVNATDGANKSYVDAATGSAPGLPANSVQFNSSPAGVFTGTSDFIWDDISKILSVNGTVIAKDHLSTSDMLLKTNIQPLTSSLSTSSLDLLSKIECYRYNLMNSDKETYSDKETFGVMAQQLEQIGLENLVHNPDDDHKSVAYMQLITLVIDSIKTLDNKVMGREPDIQTRFEPDRYSNSKTVYNSNNTSNNPNMYINPNLNIYSNINPIINPKAPKNFKEYVNKANRTKRLRRRSQTKTIEPNDFTKR
jgi:hypothetical protein